MSKWKTVRLGDVLIQQDKSKIKAGEGIDDGVYPFYTCSNELTKQINTAQYKGPALIFGTGGKASVHFCSGSFSTSTDCLVYKTSKEVNLSLVNKYLRTNMYLLENGFKGAGLKHISREYIANIEIPLPEILAQNKLVYQFDLIESSITNHKKILEKYDTLIKSRFIEMFGDPVRNSMNWEIKRLSEVCTKINDGTHNSPENYDIGDYKYITAKNIKESGFDFSNITYVSKEVHDSIYSRCNPEIGDVLYIKDGVTTGIAMVNTLEEPFSLLSSVALLKQNKKLINGSFLAAQLNYPQKYKSIRENMGGPAITRLTIQKINIIPVIVPPLELQNDFADFVQQIDKSKFENQNLGVVA